MSNYAQQLMNRMERRHEAIKFLNTPEGRSALERGLRTRENQITSEVFISTLVGSLSTATFAVGILATIFGSLLTSWVQKALRKGESPGLPPPPAWTEIMGKQLMAAGVTDKKALEHKIERSWEIKSREEKSAVYEAEFGEARQIRRNPPRKGKIEVPAEKIPPKGVSADISVWGGTSIFWDDPDTGEQESLDFSPGDHIKIGGKRYIIGDIKDSEDIARRFAKQLKLKVEEEKAEEKEPPEKPTKRIEKLITRRGPGDRPKKKKEKVKAVTKKKAKGKAKKKELLTIKGPSGVDIIPVREDIELARAINKLLRPWRGERVPGGFFKFTREGPHPETGMPIKFLPRVFFLEAAKFGLVDRRGPIATRGPGVKKKQKIFVIVPLKILKKEQKK